MKRFEIVPRRHHENLVTGEKASIYGACPWTTDSEAANWHVVSDGYTIRDNKRGTTGGYGVSKDFNELTLRMRAKYGDEWAAIEL